MKSNETRDTQLAQRTKSGRQLAGMRVPYSCHMNRAGECHTASLHVDVVVGGDVAAALPPRSHNNFDEIH